MDGPLESARVGDPQACVDTENHEVTKEPGIDVWMLDHDALNTQGLDRSRCEVEQSQCLNQSKGEVVRVVHSHVADLDNDWMKREARQLGLSECLAQQLGLLELLCSREEVTSPKLDSRFD